MSEKIRVLVVGCGHMGASHAKAYHRMDGFEIAGLVSRGPQSREELSKDLGGDVPQFDSFETALSQTGPQAVSINTYPDTHANYAIAAMKAGAHVFIEKPLAETVAQAQEVVKVAREMKRKLVVGYILRHHPSWTKFVELARGLGKPLVVRMNLNQQSSGEYWNVHKKLMDSLSPIVDCGVHYVDMMCLMTQANPVRVHAIGARLSEELNPGMYNYGQLQVTFDDGSVGWYEAGWGPMMSQTAHFIKDVVGPRGCVSMVAGHGTASDDINSHTKTNRLCLHLSAMDGQGKFAKHDELFDMADEPDHQGLCQREQEYFLKAILEDADLSEHMSQAVHSLRIVLAADQSIRTGKTVMLQQPKQTPKNKPQA